MENVRLEIAKALVLFKYDEDGFFFSIFARTNFATERTTQNYV